jgi:hypothetical protein
MYNSCYSVYEFFPLFLAFLGHSVLKNAVPTAQKMHYVTIKKQIY